MSTAWERRLEKPPFFSICIPQYERLPFLVETVSSISAQSFRDFEVCISDDLSPSISIATLTSLFEGTGLHGVIVRQEVNVRYDHNLRTAMSLAAGRYCFLLGNDDALKDQETLESVAREIRETAADVVITNYEDFRSGAIHRRVMVREVTPGDAAVAARVFRNFSFVSGVVFDREKAQGLATAACDGSEMYQMYIGAAMIARGAKLLQTPLVAIRKDISIAGDEVDSYRTKKDQSSPFATRRIPLADYARTAASAINPAIAEKPERAARTAAIIRQVYMFTYPYWLVEYRRSRSWPFAYGVARGMRPRVVCHSLELGPGQLIIAVLLYATSTLAGLLVPTGLITRLEGVLRSIAKRRAAAGRTAG